MALPIADPITKPTTRAAFGESVTNERSNFIGTGSEDTIHPQTRCGSHGKARHVAWSYATGDRPFIASPLSADEVPDYTAP